MSSLSQAVRQNFAIKSFSVLAALLPRSVAAGLLALQLGVALTLAAPIMAMPTAAHAQAYKVKPLMIIRFNQPNVRFERPLATAIARAQAAKPDVHYTLVMFSPSYGDEATQQQLAERSELLLNQVRAQMTASGVSSGNVEVARQRSTAITHTEIHILVR